MGWKRECPVGRILDSTGQVAIEKGLLTRARDPYWDGFLTRREAQLAIDKLSENDSVLMAMQDTEHIVMNFLVEKIGCTREELDKYVELKKAQLAALRQAALEAKAQAPAETPDQPITETANEQGNG